MIKTKSVVVTLISLIFIAFILWGLLTPKNNIQEIVAKKLQEDMGKSDVEFKLVKFSEVADGIKYWELNAKSSTIDKTSGIANLKTVDGLFFKDGKPALKFIAPAAVWNLENKEIHLINPVGYDTKFEKEIESQLATLGGIKKLSSYFSLPSEKQASKSKGYWFKAKELDWKLATKKLTCKGGIILTKGDITIYSKELEADAALEKVFLSNNPYAVLTTKKDKAKIKINAESFLVDSHQDKIYANNNVEVKSKSAVISGRNAVYNQIIKKILLSDNVQLNTSTITAWSNDALFSLSDYIAELSGNARARRGESELQGGKIVVLTEEGKLFIIGNSRVKIQESDVEKLK